MKKVLCALVLVFVLCSASFAASSKVDSGILTYLGTTEGEFQEALDGLRKSLASLIPVDGDDGGWADTGEDRLESFILDLVKTRRVIHFYDSLLSMQMALRSRKIDEFTLPEAVGMYLVSNNSKYEIKFSLSMMPSTISFGFKKGKTSLQQEFNTAINAMKKDGTLRKLETKYVSELSGEPSPARFQEFKGAETIKVAVTGDLPPIDYIAADGRPTGYNTAILSEIGKRLKKNIRLISVEAGGRSAALASERADVVFWYRNTEGMKLPRKAKGAGLKGVMNDSPEGVILSVPYYEWDTDLVIGRFE